MSNKIWILTHESENDGKHTIDCVPCATEEIAKKILKDKIFALSRTSYPNYENNDDYSYEITDNSFYIEDMCGDANEYIVISEKTIVTE